MKQLRSSSQVIRLERDHAYGLLVGEEPLEEVKLGWAHSALMTTYPGDTTMATLEQVRAFAKGGSARIQR